jgi:hypothetical protein
VVLSRQVEPFTEVSVLFSLQVEPFTEGSVLFPLQVEPCTEDLVLFPRQVATCVEDFITLLSLLRTMPTDKLPTDISLSVKSETPDALATDAVRNRTDLILLFLYLIDCAMIHRLITSLFFYYLLLMES